MSATTLSASDLARYEELGRSIGHDIGAHVAEKLGAALDRHMAAPTPFKFRGDVPLAAMERDEANALAEHLEYVGEYANSVEHFAAAGLSLRSFVESRLAEVHGVGMVAGQGYQGRMTDALRNALDKQGEQFAQKFAIRSHRGGLGLDDGLADDAA